MLPLLVSMELNVKKSIVKTGVVTFVTFVRSNRRVVLHNGSIPKQNVRNLNRIKTNK